MAPSLFPFALVLLLQPQVSGVSQAATSPSTQEIGVLRTLDRAIDHCAAFVYRTSDATNDDLILMTDDLGEYVTRAWVNLGKGDIELKKVSYHEDDKRLAFVFAGDDIEVRFEGNVTVPASESQEYSVLRGRISVKQGSRTETRVVYVHNGC